MDADTTAALDLQRAPSLPELQRPALDGAERARAIAVQCGNRRTKQHKALGNDGKALQQDGGSVDHSILQIKF